MCGLEIMLVRLSLGDRFLDKIRMKYRRLFESVYKYTHWLLIIGMKECGMEIMRDRMSLR